MSAPRRFLEAREQLVEAFAAGCSTRDAACHAEVGERSVKRWLTAGRRDPAGAFGAFAAEVDAARVKAAEGGPPLDARELALVVSERARRGNVQAMRLRWLMLLDEDRAA